MRMQATTTKTSRLSIATSPKEERVGTVYVAIVDEVIESHAAKATLPPVLDVRVISEDDTADEAIRIWISGLEPGLVTAVCEQWLTTHC